MVHRCALLFWECEGEIGIRQGQIKCGCKRLTTVKQIPVPSISVNSLVNIGFALVRKYLPEAPEIEEWLSLAEKGIYTPALTNSRYYLTHNISVYCAMMVAHKASWASHTRKPYRNMVKVPIY